jgi:hypothetical protein
LVTLGILLLLLVNLNVYSGDIAPTMIGESGVTVASITLVLRRGYAESVTPWSIKYPS